MKSEIIKLAILFFLVLAGSTGSSRAEDDMAQICMFRCAPVIGTSKYDQCLDECFTPEKPKTKQSAKAKRSKQADLAALDGYWLNKRMRCGALSDDSWSIDASGASGFESSCTLRSSSKKGKILTLKQRCEYYENEVQDVTVRIRIISGKEIEISGTRYKKCPRP